MKILLSILLTVLALATIIGAYWHGRNEVLILEYKKCQADMINLTYWETNQPPELKELVKAHYYFLSNRIPKNWADPKDYGPVSTNIGSLGAFKGPTSAQIEYTNYLERYGLTKK